MRRANIDLEREILNFVSDRQFVKLYSSNDRRFSLTLFFKRRKIQPREIRILNWMKTICQ